MCVSSRKFRCSWCLDHRLSSYSEEAFVPFSLICFVMAQLCLKKKKKEHLKVTLIVLGAGVFVHSDELIENLFLSDFVRGCLLRWKPVVSEERVRSVPCPLINGVVAGQIWVPPLTHGPHFVSIFMFTYLVVTHSTQVATVQVRLWHLTHDPFLVELDFSMATYKKFLHVGSGVWDMFINQVFRWDWDSCGD